MFYLSRLTPYIDNPEAQLLITGNPAQRTRKEMKARYALLPMITICTAAIALGQGKFDGTWQSTREKAS